jgi:hypothetical protein
MIIALFVYLLNVVMLDDFLYNLTGKLSNGAGSDFDSTGIITMFAQVESFMPILIIGLGLGYFFFSRVFGQESQDWLT